MEMENEELEMLKHLYKIKESFEIEKERLLKTPNIESYHRVIENLRVVDKQIKRYENGK